MMSRGLFSVVIVLAFAGLLGYAAFAAAKRAVSEGKGGQVQIRALIALVVVALAELWLWSVRIPDTPGSPAALVLWLVKGGAMLMFGIVGVLGIGSLIGARSRTAGPFEGGN